MNETPTPSCRVSAQALLRRLFVALILPWAFVSAQAASAHIAPVPVYTIVSAATGKVFVADVRNGVATVKVERGGTQPGKSAPPAAIISVASRSAHGGTVETVGFSPIQRPSRYGSAPSSYWSRGPPRAAPAFEITKTL